MKPFLSVVIPAYNEELRLPETLALFKDFFDRQDYAVEVLLVDDGSQDGTVRVARESARDFPALRIIANEKNKGKGQVVKQGMLAAEGEYCLFTDADNSTPITELPKLLAHARDYDVVIGSRYLDPDSIKVRQPWKRRLLSRASNLLIRWLLLPGIRDTQCGFKLFSREAVQRVMPLQKMSGWSFDFEVLAIARYLGYTIKEVPVDWFDAKNSTLRARHAAYQSLKDLWAINRRLHRITHEDI